MSLGRAYPGGMQISYNGEVVGDASTLNFVSAGGEISVAFDPSDTSQINAYHPGATFASNWTLNDGIFGSGAVPSTPTATRRIGTPTSEGTPFLTSGLAGTLSAGSRTSSMVFSPAGEIRFEDQASTFTISVTLGGSLLFSETTAVIAANGSFALPNVGSVAVTNFMANTSEFKGNVSVTIPVGTLVPNSGTVLIQIRHNNGAASNQFTQTFFYDSESNTAVQGTPTLALNVPVVKVTSGISALAVGTTWDITIPGIDYAFSDTAPVSLLNLVTSGIGVTNKSIASDAFGTTAFNATALAHSETLTLANTGLAICGSVDFSSTLNDWSVISTNNSNSLTALILTKAASSQLVETFGDEVYRLVPALSAWNSVPSLTATDLVVACGKLQRRGTDYSQYLPHGVSGIVNPDYTSGGATQTYYRVFSDLGTSRQNASIVLEGLVSETGIDIEFTINGTDWFDIKDGYVGGTLLPGSGAKTGGSGNTYEFTLSVHNTFASGQIILRISMTTAHELTGLNLTWV